jgi:N-acetylglucosaminyldiphosphoundecaprenol N-acetyl-beta-D-mannosaminyltransferase
VRQKSLRGDLGILLRSLIAAVLSGGERPQPPTLQLFGVAIDNISMDEALDWMLARARSGPQVQAAFVNPDCLNIAYRHTDYRTVLQRADKVFPDGIGLQLACRMLGIGLRANVNGTDLFPLLCERLAGSDSGIFLLGAQPGMAAATAENMTSRYPGLRIVGVEHGYFSAAEQAQLIERINASGASILLVALGAPRQELWLAEQRDRLQANVLLGVGGLFDYYSGRIPRAPLWMREIGLEWVWRLLQEPARLWRRYIIGNPLFLYRVWKQGRRESKHE